MTTLSFHDAKNGTTKAEADKTPQISCCETGFWNVLLRTSGQTSSCRAHGGLKKLDGPAPSQTGLS